MPFGLPLHPAPWEHRPRLVLLGGVTVLPTTPQTVQSPHRPPGLVPVHVTRSTHTGTDDDPGPTEEGGSPRTSPRKEQENLLVDPPPGPRTLYPHRWSRASLVQVFPGRRFGELRGRQNGRDAPPSGTSLSEYLRSFVSLRLVDVGVFGQNPFVSTGGGAPGQDSGGRLRTAMPGHI